MVERHVDGRHSFHSMPRRSLRHRCGTELDSDGREGAVALRVSLRHVIRRRYVALRAPKRCEAEMVYAMGEKAARRWR